MEESWEKVGVLEGLPKVRALVASPDGYAVIGTQSRPKEGDGVAKLRARVATIVVATPDGLHKTHEEAGWIEALDGVGDSWFAVHAKLNFSNEGSDYKLLRSKDRGLSWEDLGAIDVRSIARVLAVSEREAWILGAKQLLAVSDDDGRTWRRLRPEGERKHFREKLCRDGDGVAVVGLEGIISTVDKGHTWKEREHFRALVHDIDGDHVLGTWGRAPAGVAKRDEQQPYSTLPAGRLPLRLVVEGRTMRVLSRAAKPESGAEMLVHRSVNDGRTWSDHPLLLTPMCDIAGPGFGAGVDVLGGIHLGRDA